MSRKVQPTYTPEEVKAAFKVFEAPNSGLQVGPCPLLAQPIPPLPRSRLPAELTAALSRTRSPDT